MKENNFNKNNHSPFHLRVQTAHDQKEQIGMQIVLALFLYITISLYVFYAVAIPFTPFILLPGLLVLVLVQLKGRVRAIGMASLAAILLFLFFYYFTYIGNGMLIVINHITEQIGAKYGVVILPYEVSIVKAAYQTGINLFFMYVGIMIALCMAYIVLRKRVYLLWVLTITCIVLQLIYHGQASFYVHVHAGLLCAVILFTLWSIQLHTKKIGKINARIFITAMLPIFIVVAIASATLFWIKPEAIYEKNEHVTTFAQDSIMQINQLRYEKNETNSFTDGDFTRLNDLTLAEDVALEVIMDKPTSYYLRGFVGSEYTKNKWEPLKSEMIYENKDTTYWLQKEGFHALNQLSILNNLTAIDSLSDTTKITINNVAANSKYYYIPYELHTDPEKIIGKKSFRDDMLTTPSFFGDRFYQYEAYTNLVAYYPTLAKELYQLPNDVQKSYVNKESHYNTYVYETYTSLPTYIEALLDNHIEIAEDEKGHIAYEQAIDFIKQYLQENISYSLTPEKQDARQDFLLHTLEDAKEGYAVHYATAATLMFRYVGIPARYVEGYLITPKDIKDKEPYEKIDIRGTNAHAWTEIYLDQIGWIPLEMTPPYEKMMAQTDMSHYPKGTDGVMENNPLHERSSESDGTRKIKDKEKDEKEKVKDEKKDRNLTWQSSLVYLLIVLALLPIGLYLIYFTKKRLRLATLKKLCQQQDRNAATNKLFAYVLTLFHYDGIAKRGGSVYDYKEEIEKKYGSSLANKFTEAIRLNQVALFSKHTMTEQQYETMVYFQQEALEEIVSQKGFGKRLKMKMWDVMY